MALGLSISVFIDQKGTLRSTTRHDYLTDQALLPYTETKSVLMVTTVTEEVQKEKILFLLLRCKHFPVT